MFLLLLSVSVVSSIVTLLALVIGYYFVFIHQRDTNDESSEDSSQDSSQDSSVLTTNSSETTIDSSDSFDLQIYGYFLKYTQLPGEMILIVIKYVGDFHDLFDDCDCGCGDLNIEFECCDNCANVCHEDCIEFLEWMVIVGKPDEDGCFMHESHESGILCPNCYSQKSQLLNENESIVEACPNEWEVNYFGYAVCKLVKEPESFTLLPAFWVLEASRESVIDTIQWVYYMFFFINDENFDGWIDKESVYKYVAGIIKDLIEEANSTST